MVRGMVPKRKASGIEAFKRLRGDLGIPDQLKDSKMDFFEDCKNYEASIGLHYNRRCSEGDWMEGEMLGN